MELLLILIFLVGVGALLLGVARRRAAERPAPRPADSAARAVEASGGPVIAAAAITAEPDRSDLAVSPTPPPPEIPDQAPADRRKHQRMRSDQTFVITPFAGQPIMAQCSDLSAGGMRFGVVGCTLRAGDLVRVTFNIGAETVGAIGSVLRVRELDPITSEVSLEFVRLDPWASQLLEQALQAEA